MAFIPNVVNVGVGATPIYLGGKNNNGFAATTLIVRNVGAQTVYLGGPLVDALTGFPLRGEELITFSAVSPADLLYGITSSGSSELRVLTMGP